MTRKRVIVVSDDLGRSSSVNEAVHEACENGVLTAASIMAGGEACAEALRLCASHPELSPGLHVTLCDGRPVLPGEAIPGLIGLQGSLESSPARAWLSLSRPELRDQVARELEAQFGVLEDAGISPSHVDGHHHLHMHAAVFPLVCRAASAHGAGWVRIPHEPLSMLTRCGRGLLPFAEWAVFRIVGRRHRQQAHMHGLRAADRVMGLACTGRLDVRTLMRYLEGPGEVVEIFAHPDRATPQGRRELEALISPRVRERIDALGVQLTGYRDAAGDAAARSVQRA